MKTTSWTRVAGMVVALVLPAAGAWTRAQERPRTSSSVQVPAQGGNGVEPVAGAPPVVAPSATTRPARATAAPGPHRPQSEAARKPSLRAVSLGDGEATVELGGVREQVRPGSRLGGDTVRSIAPGRIVLERPAPAGDAGGPALVIVTFDEAGNGKTQVYWTHDPARPAELKKP